MRLQSKFSLVLLELALIPMLFIGFLSYSYSKNEIVQQVLQQLEATAALQEERTHDLVAFNVSQLRMTTSRAQLQENFEIYQRTGSKIAYAKALESLNEAFASMANVEKILLLDHKGKAIISTDAKEIGRIYSDAALFAPENNHDGANFLVKYEKKQAHEYLAGPLLFNKKVIGTLVLVKGVEDLMNITNDYTGLGETGETVIAYRNGNGDAVTITPLRSDADQFVSRVTRKEEETRPIIKAIAGLEDTFVDTQDYRGKTVFSATRYIEDLGWGLITKIDAEEALASTYRLRNILILLGGISTLLILLIVLFAVRSLTRPLVYLTAVTKRLAGGNLSETIQVEGDDEIGQLGRSFQNMASQLKNLYDHQEAKVKEKTQQLSSKVRELEHAQRTLKTNAQLIEREKAKDEALLESIGDGLVALDKEGRIFLMNPPAEQMLGVTLADARGQIFNDVWQTQYEDGTPVPHSQRPIQRALKEGKKCVETKLSYVRPDGKAFPVAINASPIVFNGETIGVIDVFRDIRNEKDIDKAKTEFVSLASHQLRTPLSAINWYAEMLLAGDAGAINDEQKKYVEEIYQGNRRMVELVNALLNVSRLDLGTFVVEPEPTEITGIATSVLSELQPQIVQKQLILTTTFAKNLPIMQLDPKLMRIVFQNLLSNAVKYTPKGGSITLKIAKEKTDKLSICVTDTGYGIPKEQQAKIFTKLFRADNVRERETDGTGLGLYMVKAIIQQSGGKVWFESEENKGTTFFVRLPLKGMMKKDGTKGLT